MEKSSEDSKFTSNTISQPYPTNETEVLFPQALPQANPVIIPYHNPNDPNYIPAQYPQYPGYTPYVPYPSNSEFPHYVPSAQYPQYQSPQIQPVLFNLPVVPLSLAQLAAVKEGRKARIWCYINSCLEILTLVGFIGLIIFVLIGIIGIFATSRFNKCLAVTYIVLLYIVVLIKLIVIVVYPYPVIVGILTVLIILNIVVSVYFIKFVKRISILSQSEVELCRNHFRSQRRICC